MPNKPWAVPAGSGRGQSRRRCPTPTWTLSSCCDDLVAGVFSDVRQRFLHQPVHRHLRVFVQRHWLARCAPTSRRCAGSSCWISSAATNPRLLSDDGRRSSMMRRFQRDAGPASLFTCFNRSATSGAIGPNPRFRRAVSSLAAVSSAPSSSCSSLRQPVAFVLACAQVGNVSSVSSAVRSSTVASSQSRSVRRGQVVRHLKVVSRCTTLREEHFTSAQQRQQIDLEGGCAAACRRFAGTGLDAPVPLSNSSLMALAQLVHLLAADVGHQQLAPLVLVAFPGTGRSSSPVRPAAAPALDVGDLGCQQRTPVCRSRRCRPCSTSAAPRGGAVDMDSRPVSRKPRCPVSASSSWRHSRVTVSYGDRSGRPARAASRCATGRSRSR